MAKQKDTSNGRVIYTKYVGHDGKFFRGEFQIVSPGHFVAVVSEQKITAGEIEETVNEAQIVRVPRLRPAGKMTAEERNDRQAKIDAYLKKEEIDALDALAEITEGTGKSKKTFRLIEQKLKFEVEKYLIEERQIVKVPIIRASETVDYEEVARIPVFVRLLPSDFRKMLNNYIKTI